MTDRIRVLIVGDLPTDAELNEHEVRQVLPASEFLRVETREDFLASLESFRPDIILSDYKLPHFDGMAALKLAKERAPEVPFIIITGSMNEDTAVECMKAGAWDYIIKEHMRRLGPAVLNGLDQKQSRLERKRAEDEHFSHFRFLESLERVDQAIRKTNDLEHTLREVLDAALSIFNSDRAWLAYPCDPEAPTWHLYLERTRTEYPGAYGSGIDLPTTPDIREAFLEMLNSSSPVIYDPRSGRALPEVSRQFNAQSQIQTAVYPKMGKPWIFGMHQCSHARVWSDYDARLFTEIARRLADSLSSLLFLKDLRESEGRLRTLVKTIPDLVWLKDVNGVYLACNPMFERFFGAKEADILGKTDYDFVNRELADFFRQHDRKAMAAGKPSSNEEWITFADDGHRAFLDTVKTPMYDTGGTIIGVLGIARDITDRTRVEEALRQSEKRYRLLFDNMLEGFAYCKLVLVNGKVQDFIYLKVNNAFERLTGLRDVVGKKVTEAIPGILATNPELLEIYGRVASTGTPERFETFSNAFGGWLSISVYSTEKDHFVAVFDNITERKKAEEELRFKNAVLATQQETAIDGILLVGGEGKILNYNTRFIDLWGLAAEVVEARRDEMVLKLVLGKVAHPEEFLKKVKHLYEAREEKSRDEIALKDGRTFDRYSAPMLSSDGKYYGRIWYFRDITERKLAAEELLKERDKAQKYFEIAGVMLAVLDREGRVVLINPKGCEILGYDRKEIIGVDWFGKILPARLRDEIEGVFLKFMADSSKPFEYFENPVVTKAGVERIIAFHNTVVRDSASQIIGVLFSGEDITERKQAELELAASEAQFRKLYQEFHGLLDAVPDSLMLLDKDLKVLWANRVAADFIGSDPEALTGHYCHSLWYKRTTPCDPCPVIESFSIGRSLSVTVTRPDGRTFDIRTVPLRDEGGTIARVIEVVREITEHRQLEAQYLQAQKMESIGTLAGGIAHDFNNILSAIIGYGHVTLMKMAEDDPQRLNIEHMLEAADRATYLTKSLLLFSRKQITERKSAELNELVRKVEKFLRRVIGEDIECKTVLSDNSIPIFADSNQLEQVLMNFAINARDAMPGGGAFTVKTEQIDLTEDFTRAHGYGKAGPYAMMTISDTGVGMDEATRTHIFEPFFTTKEVGKGTGLGLAVVYGIIKQHDGFINVYSEPGKGTTFRIYLPIIGAVPTDDAKTPHLEAPARGTETILVAEDDENLRKLSRTVLTEFGYTVIEAVDGEDAVKKFAENKATIKLLLFDLIMPKMNGKEASDEIRKIKPDMKVLFVSGYDPDLVQQKELLEACVSLVYKPISPMDLLRRVRSVLDGITQ